MKVTKCEIPAKSLLRQFTPVDYADSFRCPSGGKKIVPDDLMVGFWTDMPVWVRALFKLRHALVRLAGLQGSDDENPDELGKAIRSGEDYRFIKFPAKDERETVMLLHDKHLDAYLSVRIEDDGMVYANTLVKYNNGLGRFYFFVIRPFHNVVVRAMVKRAIEKLENSELKL